MAEEFQLETIQTAIRFCRHAYVRTPAYVDESGFAVIEIPNNPEPERLFAATRKDTLLIDTRGSENLHDFVLDAKFYPALDDKFIKVHAGVKEYGDSILECVYDLVNSISSKEVLLTGHSLGAACAEYISAKIRVRFPDVAVRCVTFACLPFVSSVSSIDFPLTSYILDDDLVQHLFILQTIVNVFYFLFKFAHPVAINFEEYLIPNKYHLETRKLKVVHDEGAAERFIEALEAAMDGQDVVQDGTLASALLLLDEVSIMNYKPQLMATKKEQPNLETSKKAVLGCLSYIKDHSIDSYARYFGVTPVLTLIED